MSLILALLLVVVWVYAIGDNCNGVLDVVSAILMVVCFFMCVMGIDGCT